jgi:lipase chaperone LimK
MDSLLDNKLTIAAAAAAVVFGVAGMIYLQRADVPGAAAPAPAAASWDGPIGAGMLARPAGAIPALGAALHSERDAQFTLDKAGHLVPDFSLRKLIDAFLAKSKGAERAAQVADLRVFLNGRLAAPAAQEADRVVTDYLAYLGAEEQMLARERFSRPDPSGLSDAELAHLLAWQQQRMQLRERMLGSQVAKAWFEAEDAGCATALREWQVQRQPVDGTHEPDSVELTQRRLHGAALEERRNNNAQLCAGQLSAGLAGGR